MNFIENIFKSSNFHSGFLFENNKIKIIKIKEVGDNFSPMYWEISDFDYKNFEKKEMINFFKNIQKKLNTKKINIHFLDIKNEAKEKEIYSNIQIAGFEIINFVNWNFNIDNLIIDEKNMETTIFAFFDNEKDIEINYVKNINIYKKEKYNFDLLTEDKIKNIFAPTENKHIFISGYFKNFYKEIEEKFYRAGIKVRVFNLWKNILSFKKEIPALFKNESHQYIKVISLTLPPIKGITNIEEKIKNNLENTNKKNIDLNKTEDLDIDFIIDNKKESEIISEKFVFWDSIKRFFNKIIWGPKESKSFKYLYEKNHILNKKIYLPKPKLKLFLPKPKKIDNNSSKNNSKKIKNKEKRKIIHQVIIEPKESKNFKYFHEKNHILNKQIKLPKFKNKIFLPKPKKNTNSFWQNIKEFFSQPVLFQIKNKKDKK